MNVEGGGGLGVSLQKCEIHQLFTTGDIIFENPIQ